MEKGSRTLRLVDTESGAGSNQLCSKLRTIRKVDIPAYLHRSEFYRSLLDEEENSCITVPCDCMKIENTVINIEELRNLLLTLRFWVGGSICDSVLSFALSHPFESYEGILKEFYEDLPVLRHMKAIVAAAEPMLEATKSGVLDFVKYFICLGYTWPNSACDIICKAGNAALLEYAIETGCTITKEATTFAAGEGHVACLQLLHENGAYWDEATTTAATKGGHLHCLQYAHEKYCPWLCSVDEPAGYFEVFEYSDNEIEYGYEEVSEVASDAAPDAASDAASIPCLELSTVGGFDEGLDIASYHSSDDAADDDGGGEGAYVPEKGGNNICTIAAAHARLDCLQYAHRQGVTLQHNAIRAAAKHPQGLDCLKYLHQQSLPLTKALCVFAARNTNMEMVQYLHANSCLWDETVCEAAAVAAAERGTNKLPVACSVVLFLLRHGCLPSNNIWDFTGDDFHQILKCFLELGFSWSATPKATARVAKTNFMEGLKCLIDSGCPWDMGATFQIAVNNNMEMLAFAHENGCPWDYETCTIAATVGSLECLKYAHTHGAHISINICVRMMCFYPGCVKKISLECFTYAHQHSGGVLLPRYTSYAARSGRLDLLQYLHEHGCEWEGRAAVMAAQYGHAECLEYMLSRGCKYSDAVYDAAKAKNHDLCMSIAEKL